MKGRQSLTAIKRRDEEEKVSRAFVKIITFSLHVLSISSSLLPSPPSPLFRQTPSQSSAVLRLACRLRLRTSDSRRLRAIASRYSAILSLLAPIQLFTRAITCNTCAGTPTSIIVSARAGNIAENILASPSRNPPVDTPIQHPQNQNSAQHAEERPRYGPGARPTARKARQR